jgi:hypothetical protein
MFCVLQECTNLETTHYLRSGRQQVILNKVSESGLNQEPFRSCKNAQTLKPPIILGQVDNKLY